MPRTPLIDFEALDLSEVVVDRETLDRYLLQRNTFSLLDGLLHEDAEGRLLVGYKDIRSDDWWASDHIPGKPMFPGALQIEVAAQLSAYDFSAHRMDRAGGHADKFVGFGGTDRVRFRGLVEPDCRLIMVSRLVKHSSRMFRYDTQGYVDRELRFEAEILGVLI